MIHAAGYSNLLVVSIANTFNVCLNTSFIGSQ